MARTIKKRPPLTAGTEQIAESLRSASGRLVEAQDGLEAAREPIRAAKATVKAVGIDLDVFRLFHGIRHLEDDVDRRRRVNMLRACEAALLGDLTDRTSELFEADETPAVLPPETAAALRAASDTLAEDDVPEPAFVEPAAAERAVREMPEPVWDDALATGDAVPADAGHSFAAGWRAGIDGRPEDACGLPDGAGRALWLRGHARGTAERDIATFVLDVDEGGERHSILRRRDGDSGIEAVVESASADALHALAAALNERQAASLEALDDAHVAALCREMLDVAAGHALAPKYRSAQAAESSGTGKTRSAAKAPSAAERKLQAAKAVAAGRPLLIPGHPSPDDGGSGGDLRGAV